MAHNLYLWIWNMKFIAILLTQSLLKKPRAKSISRQNCFLLCNFNIKSSATVLEYWTKGIPLSCPHYTLHLLQVSKRTNFKMLLLTYTYTYLRNIYSTYLYQLVKPHGTLKPQGFKNSLCVMQNQLLYLINSSGKEKRDYSKCQL